MGKRICFAPESQRAIERGVALLEQTLGPTLGPAGRPVAVARTGQRGASPELIDDGATIARRMTDIPNQFENVGFQLARKAAWTMQSLAGDGAATALVMMSATLRQLNRLRAAGMDRRELQADIERSQELALAMLDSISKPFGLEQLHSLLDAQLGDRATSCQIRTAIERFGPDVWVDVRAAAEHHSRPDLVEGALWESTGRLSLFHDHAHDTARITLADADVLLWDGELENVEEVAEALNRCVDGGSRQLLVVARAFSPDVAGLLFRAVQGGFKAIPVLAPLAGTQQALAYGDIQALTGARLLSPVAGDRVSRIEPAALGRAPRIVVGARFFNITSSDRQSVEIALRLRAIERVIEQTDDEQERRLHRLRYARLTQQLAVVWIGGPTGPDRDARVRQVRRTIDQLQRVQRAGVVPGGGATLLAIARRLRDEAVETGRSGLLAVADGLDAPARWIAKNAGHDPGAMVHRLGPYVPERGLNVRTGQIVSLRETGVLDATSTLRAAITVGLSMANQASDCEALVLRQNELWQVQLTP